MATDLFGEAPRRGKAKVDHDPGPVQRCIDAYFTAYSARWGMPPIIHGGKDGSHFKKLVAAWGVDVVLDVIAQFFATTNPRVVRSDYSVGALFALAQAIRLEELKPADDRTLANIDAATRALRRRRVE